MIKEMILFEWLPFRKKWSFYLLLLVFFGLGVVITMAGNFPFPDVYHNAPYTIGFIISLFSLINIFTVTIITAQVLLRERDAGFQQILYATPVKKEKLFISRVFIIIAISVLLFAVLVAGFMVGNLLPVQNRELTAFNFSYYLLPFLYIGIPNIIFCTAVICFLGWLSKNKLMIYLSGLLIYVFYIVGSVFSNSPLMANASPASDEAMAMAARFDPFGIAAFFEQTKHWSILQRNTQLLSLSGNLLWNRIAWLFFSFGCFVLSLRFFKLIITDKKIKKRAAVPETQNRKFVYKQTATQTGSGKHALQTVLSFIKIDFKSIVKGIPFSILCLLWIFLLGMEIYSEIDAGIRLPERYATTALMINRITGTIPVFCLMAIIFYSNELIWRSRNSGIAALENSTSANSTMVFISKLVSLSVIPLLLVALSVIIGITFQLLYGYPHINWALYGSLFYIIALPMICCLAIVMSLQVIVKNKYAGIAVAVVFILLTNTSIGKLAGLKNPLFRIGNSYTQRYSEMNGYGSYLQSFSWTLLYAAAIALLVLVLAGYYWNRSTFKGFFKGKFERIFSGIALLLLLLSGGHIFYQGIQNPVLSKTEQYDWQQNYEAAYRRYANMPQPAITVMQTNIDLYPEENRYQVSGTYWLKNNTDKPMDTLLVYFGKESHDQVIDFASAMLLKKDEGNNHYFFRLKNTLKPSDSIQMKFSFNYSWSPFKGHESFNSIVENGTFLRISRYYPVFGYQSGNEIDDEIIRKERIMPAKTPEKKAEDTTVIQNSFVWLDMQVSTSADQTAIAVGELEKQWKKDTRQYFHYKTNQPVPFRFAVSSAKYAVKKELFNGRLLEVFYDPAHGENVDRLMATAKNTLVYCEKNFGPYPYKTVRFAEVSGFTRGFAATAYPATVFMTEDVVFHTNIKNSTGASVINELASHELAHEWWGGVPLHAAQKEGAVILSESLAMYTEMMLNKQAGDSDAVLKMVQLHKGLYFNDRMFDKERPLYKAQGGQVFLSYNKGLVSMYQLYLLIGEEKINQALHNLSLKHGYNMPAAGSLDLLNELYAVSNPEQHIKIDELFKQIITHEAKLVSAKSEAASPGKYSVTIDAEIKKFAEDGSGKKNATPFTDSVDIALYSENNQQQLFRFPVVNGKIKTTIVTTTKPTRVEMDPLIKLLDPFDDDNVKELK